jgi:hypothetical protein
MDQDELDLEGIVNKLLWGKSLCSVSDSTGKSHQFILRSLTIKESNYIQYLHQNELENAIQQGVIKQKDLEDLYEAAGVWSESDEQYIRDVELKIRQAKHQLKSLTFMPAKRVIVERQLVQLEKDLHEKVNERTNLFLVSAEIRAEEIKRRFTVMLSTETIEEKRFWATQSDFLNENDLDLIFNLSLAYYNNNLFPENVLRKVARSGAWRFRWNASKKGADLFGKPIAEWSEMQNMIVYWSQYYDYVYESLERPSDAIIDTDAACDAWVEEQSKKSQSKTTGGNTTNALGTKKSATHKDHQEQFIMVQAGDKETIKQVQKMNPDSIRAKLRKENAVIKEKGRISEWQLRRGEYENNKKT